MVELALTPTLPGIERRLAGTVLLLCALALILPALGQVLGAPLAGWAANHGHAGHVALDAHHVHPYQHASTTAGDGGFTFSDEGAAGVAVAPPDDPIALPAAPASFEGPPTNDGDAVASAVVAVPTPPPRTPPV